MQWGLIFPWIIKSTVEVIILHWQLAELYGSVSRESKIVFELSVMKCIQWAISEDDLVISS